MRFKIFFASLQLFAPDMRQIEKDKPLKKNNKMKKQMVMMMAAVLMCCTSCIKLNLSDINKLEPSDNIVKNEYKMEPFSKVDVDLAAKVKFVQSSEGDYRVLMKCPDNYVDLFSFKVRGDELELAFAENLRKSLEFDEVSIVVCTPTLLKIDSEGLGSITIDSLKTPSLRIDSEGVCNLNIKGLTTEELKVESSGVGNIELQGVAKTAELECDGVGNINAEELKAEEVKAEVNGVGSISCFASQRIQGDINGVGSLKYGGNPSEKKLQRNGVGSIKEL